MVNDVNGDVIQKRQDSNAYLDDIKAEAETYLSDINPFPYIPSSFDYSTLVSNAKVVTVTMTRLSDSVTATCDIAPTYTPLDECEYTQLDEMKFDYLCSMVPTIQ